MSETGFWWTHWGHLVTKPILAGVLYAFALWGVTQAGWPHALAWGVALFLPALVSLARKAILWPGCLKGLNVWRDEFVDVWASAVLVAPLAADTMPVGYRVALGVGLAGVLWPVGLHRWALP